MARPREFDIDEALDRAMGVFWEKGYEGASLQDLLKAMQIARGSLYKAFDDKRAIYLATLDRYDETQVEKGAAYLRDPKGGDGFARIRNMFESVKKDAARRGCFICTAAMDQARVDADVKSKVATMLQKLEEALADALRNSKRGLHWSTKRRADMAAALLNNYLGLRVLARSGYPNEDLQAIIDATLSTA